MTAPRYVVDDRAAEAILAALAAAAAASRVPALAAAASGVAPDRRWADVLFRDGELIADEPSAALIHAFAELYPGLLGHLNTLPDRALVDWLERRLGIARLPVVPDRVVAVPTPDPKKLPVVVPAGTLLRGGRDTAGNERRYVTTESLAVLGSTLVDVRSYRIAPEPVGESIAAWSDPKLPFEPFPSDAVAPHTLDLVTDIIRFERDSLTVRLTFEGAKGSLPKGLVWQYSTADGLATATELSWSSNAVVLQLSGSCGPFALDGVPTTYLHVSLPPPPYPSGAFDFAFDRVTVAVTQRRGVTPEAGFFNDGVLDITKEFQPFGPVAKRGDSFYIQSDEAFAKPLSWLKVNLDLLGGSTQMFEVAWGGGVPKWLKLSIAAYPNTLAQEASKKESGKSPSETYNLYFENVIKDAGAARVAWQRFDGSEWKEFFHTADALMGITASEMSPIPEGPNRRSHSLPTTVAGVRGPMIRAFLDQGDFGWRDYQQRIAEFAAAAARPGGKPDASLLVPPEIPVISRVTLEYTTQAEQITDLRARNGWSSRKLGAGDRLFGLPLDRDHETNAAGAIAVGFAFPGTPDAGLGSTVSLYVDILSAAACTTSDAVPLVTWEYWSSTGHWLALDDVDGTIGLRQAGLLRFVAPADWASGCPDLSAPTGRWIRARTNLPDRLGTMRAIVPDAVTAEYRSRMPHPAADPTPGTALAARALKGLVVPIDGIKKFTNPLPGTVGRGPEPDSTYADRAAHWTRHRNRAIQAWDYEAIVTAEFPEVATIRCLPHTGVDDGIRPGLVGLVIVPFSDDPQPYPSVTLAERILASLGGRLPVHARPVVLCPIYVEVSVEATALLRPGFSASEGKRTIAAGIDAFLHPGEHAPFGRELFASTMVRFLETRPEIDHVTSFTLIADPCPPTVPSGPCRVERVTVDACRGLVASSGHHALTLAEQL